MRALPVLLLFTYTQPSIVTLDATPNTPAGSFKYGPDVANTARPPDIVAPLFSDAAQALPPTMSDAVPSLKVYW